MNETLNEEKNTLRDKKSSDFRRRLKFDERRKFLKRPNQIKRRVYDLAAMTLGLIFEYIRPRWEDGKSMPKERQGTGVVAHYVQHVGYQP